MKRIFSFLFAIIALVGTTSIFTACQEDAPEINFTINVTVNNENNLFSECTKIKKIVLIYQI